MILLDTHVWVWWVHGDARLSEEQREMLDGRAVEMMLTPMAIALYAKPSEIG